MAITKHIERAYEAQAALWRRLEAEYEKRLATVETGQQSDALHAIPLFAPTASTLPEIGEPANGHSGILCSGFSLTRANGESGKRSSTMFDGVQQTHHYADSNAKISIDSDGKSMGISGSDIVFSGSANVVLVWKLPSALQLSAGPYMLAVKHSVSGWNVASGSDIRFDVAFDLAHTSGKRLSHSSCLCRFNGVTEQGVLREQSSNGTETHLTGVAQNSRNLRVMPSSAPANSVGTGSRFLTKIVMSADTIRRRLRAANGDCAANLNQLLCPSPLSEDTNEWSIDKVYATVSFAGNGGTPTAINASIGDFVIYKLNNYNEGILV